MPKLKTKVRASTTIKRTVKSEEEPKSLRDRNKDNANSIQRSWYHLSKDLVETYDSDIYSRDWGFNTFREYVENELRLDYRLAMWRVGMGRTIIKHGITEKQVMSINWTTFKEISHLFTDDTTTAEVTEMLKGVENKSYQEVQSYVKDEKTKRLGGTLTRQVKMLFKLSDEQAVCVEKAIAGAMRLADTDNHSVGLEYLCNEWLMNNNPELAAEIKSRLAKDVPAPKTKYREYANKGKAKANATK